MTTAAALRTGLETRLKTIAGLRVYRRWPGQFDYPCAVITRGRAEPEQTFGRGDLTKWEFEIYLLASLAPGYEMAQDRLDGFINTSSTGGVYSAIHADRTLGGIAAGTFVAGIREDEQVELSDSLAVLGAVCEITIWAS